MKAVCIAGAMSGVGKTTLVEKLLTELNNWAACKVTACIGGKDHRCPRGKSDTCGVCSSLDTGYIIEDGESIINMPSTRSSGSGVPGSNMKSQYLMYTCKHEMNVPAIKTQSNHVVRPRSFSLPG